MSIIFDMQSEMSFREKSAWVSFVSTLLLFVAYFWTVSREYDGLIAKHSAAVMEFGLLGAFIAIEIVLHVFLTIQKPDEARAPRDEREHLIELKATRVAFYVLVVGALASVGLMHVTRSAWVIAQHIFLAVMVAGVVKFGGQIFYFRRGV